MKEAAYRYDKQLFTLESLLSDSNQRPRDYKSRYFLLRVQRYEFILKMQIRHVLFLYLQSH